MATTTNLRSLHRNANPNLLHHHHSFCRRNLISMSIFSNKLAIASLTNTNTTTTTLSPLNSTSTSTDAAATSLDALSRHLASGDLRQADEETRRLLVALAGEGAVRRGYVFFSEVQFVPAEELRAIDRLWRSHSGGRFGYSVQKRIWERRAGRDFTQFFIRVGWMRRLEAAEVEQWNYRSFPSEFTWELGDDSPPEGHLPLTNALRGTQLLASIFAHPAFEEEDQEAAAASNSNLKEEGKERSSLLGGKIKLKPADYSF
ncbi:tetrapyrrole-binding protein, chloroplastic [Iris pallida]|uniref:Tetrapyrrole-binding protein, chloroplastic n=1 Tax=Iris pallida TaxID=29817 RepID=A0AAX6FXT5_IRIPA|nr:tetrapyrrole-binding protein, chloroplastic [Iris pallida]